MEQLTTTHRHRAWPWSGRPVRRHGHRDPRRRGGFCRARGRSWDRSRSRSRSGTGTGAVQELLGLAAEVGSDRQAPANAIASRLAAWVIGHMSGDAPAFGIVAPMRDGVVMFLRGAVWCTITEGGSVREVSGEQALTWVDLIVPGTFEQLAIGGAAGRPVQADPLSDLWGGVVPGQGFVLSRTAGISGAGFADPGTAFADSGTAFADSGAGLAELRDGLCRA